MRPLPRKPHLARHVRTVAFDADTGLLILIPDPSAWGTQDRLIAGQLMARANSRIRSHNVFQLVRRIQVLSPGAPVPPRPTSLQSGSSRNGKPEGAAEVRTQVPSPRVREPPAVFAEVFARYNGAPPGANGHALMNEVAEPPNLPPLHLPCSIDHHRPPTGSALHPA